VRRLLTAAVAAVLLLVDPAVAAAGPATDLCVPDDTRGGVPAWFVLDGCAEAGSLTVRNQLGVPVLVRRTGDLGEPTRHHRRENAMSTVLYYAAGPGDLLFPGDVVRWPLGAGAAELQVGELTPHGIVGVVDTLGKFLPNLDDDDLDQSDYVTFATTVRVIASAVTTRAACVAEKNFLQVAACDATASSAISRAAIDHLPRRTARQVLEVALDPVRWADWAALDAPAAPALNPEGVYFPQTAKPEPPPPAPARTVPTPAPAPATRAPAPAAPAPAAPAPAPPAPAAPAAPAPAAREPSPLEKLIEAIRAWKQAHEGDRNGERGNGPGNGHGRGR
jgi:hypothetical protein